MLLTSVNQFAFRVEILYICSTEVEIVLNIRVISTSFVHKVTYWEQKNKYYRFYKVTYRYDKVTYRFSKNKHCCDFEGCEC